MLNVIASVIAAGDATCTERLDRLVDDLVSFSVTRIDLYHALFHDTPTTGGEPVAQFTTVLAELLQRGSDAGAFDVAMPEFTAGFLVSAFHGIGARVAHATPRTRRRMAAELKTLFRRAVAAS
jgi:hypothetical protein